MNECITPRTMLGWVPVEWSYWMYVLFTESYMSSSSIIVSWRSALHTAWDQLCPSQNVLLEEFIPVCLIRSSDCVLYDVRRV